METLQMVYLDAENLQIKKYYPKDDFYFRLAAIINGDTCVDRFSLLHEHSKYRWGEFENSIRPKVTNKSYIDICVEHAKKYIQKYDKIAVMWSGGVDSTGLIAILLEAGMNPKNIDVIGTVTSLKEAPNFDKYFKEYGIIYRKISKREYMHNFISQYTDAPVILTGICNDQLWYKGGTIMHCTKENNLSLIQNDWKKQLVTEYAEAGLMRFVLDDIDILDYYLKSLDMECDSYAEFTHMLNFCFHYEYIKYLYTLETNNEVNQKLVNFYDTQEFQDWTWYNRKYCAETAFLCSQGKYEYYKKPLKDLIYKYFKDEDYYKSKLKIASMKYYKSFVEVPFYSIGVKTNKKTKIYQMNKNITSEQYAKYAFSLLEEFKK